MQVVGLQAQAQAKQMQARGLPLEEQERWAAAVHRPAAQPETPGFQEGAVQLS